MSKPLLHTCLDLKTQPTNQTYMCSVKWNTPASYTYSVVDSTPDHLLVSSEDGPCVGMGMLEGSGEVVPTAAVYRNENGKSKTKRRLTCSLVLFYFNLLRLVHSRWNKTWMPIDAWTQALHTTRMAVNYSLFHLVSGIRRTMDVLNTVYSVHKMM